MRTASSKLKLVEGGESSVVFIMARPCEEGVRVTGKGAEGVRVTGNDCEGRLSLAVEDVEECLSRLEASDVPPLAPDGVVAILDAAFIELA
jgi:hypothetical protein